MTDSTATNSPLETLSAYINRLIDEKGFPDLTSEVRTQIHTDLMTRLNDSINAHVIAALSDDDLVGFEKLIDTNAPQEEVQTYIEGKIPDSTSFLASVMLEFRKNYLGIS